MIADKSPIPLSTAARCVYGDGVDRLGSYKQQGNTFLAFDRRNCLLGTFNSATAAYDAIVVASHAPITTEMPHTKAARAHERRQRTKVAAVLARFARKAGSL